MAFIRYPLLAVLSLFAYVNNIAAQTIYYPAGQSQLLRSTAEDMSLLFQKAIPGSHFTLAEYGNTVPLTGIVLIYDSTIANNQTCRVRSNGSNRISFTAGQDNGICYGVYEYLYQLGFRFYQPGEIWETIPLLASPYKTIDTLYTCRFKYKNWFISGGCTTWALDKNSSYYWDTYYGELGHQWSLYQRRNNMVGGYRFAGHRDDILTQDYLSTLQSNPCYVAPYNGSREATRQSVPDINNPAAMQNWASAIKEKYAGFRNTIYNNRNVYSNYYRNFNYAYGYVGIEVPDGAHWANTQLNDCGSGRFPKESDQHFTLANFTAASISHDYPGMRFQLYAYDGHANVPSPSITINPNIDIQVVPTAFQNETSAKGLLSRWYARSNNISEYHYLNLAQWSGETPSFYLDDLKQTVERLKEKNSQGIVWEAAVTKFASLPFLLAANTALKNNKSVDDELKNFCDLFGNASATVYTLLKYWSSDKTVTVYNSLQDNKYKLPLYFQLVNRAAAETADASPLVKQRITELKAYLHYLSLYYDWAFDQNPPNKKTAKAAGLCHYLAKISRLQVVNSSVLINNIVQQYSSTDEIYTRFNIATGTAYEDEAVSSVNATEIENLFNNDNAAIADVIGTYSFAGAEEIKSRFEQGHLEPLDKINIQVGYTNGKDYTARTELFVLADKPGQFTIRFSPKFEMDGKGYINFTAESVDALPGVIKDFSIDNASGPGVLQVDLPAAGNYRLTISSKYKSSAAITINTNGNYFYKNGPFWANGIENYRSDLLSLPGWFYIPAGTDKVYFSVNNSNPGGTGFATAAEISKAFVLKDDNLNTIEPVVTSDSALFYLQLPAGHKGVFYRAFKMEQYRLCFANISNITWYAQKKKCAGEDFSATIKTVNQQCITQVTANGLTAASWEVYDAQQWFGYNNKQTVQLPETISPNAIVIMKSSNGCAVVKRLGDETNYLKQKAACAMGGSPADNDVKVVVYPNPGTGIFKCMQNGLPVIAEEIWIFNTAGARVGAFTNTAQFNIATLPAGIYFYHLTLQKSSYKGKLVKL